MQNERKSLFGLIASGFFIALPVLLIGLALDKIHNTLKAVVLPLLDALPGEVFHDPMIRGIVMIVAIVVLLVLVGLLARTRIGRATGSWLEAAFLNHLPLYAFLHNLTSGMSGKDDNRSFRSVLVTVNPGLHQLGLLIERHADGSGTVFLPSSPNPVSGTVLVVEATLIRELHVPAHRLFQSLSSWGDGTAKVLDMARDIKGKDGLKEEIASD